MWYHQKYVAPLIHTALGVISFFAYMASLFMIVSAVLEFGFRLTGEQMDELNWLYFWVWITFLTDRSSHLLVMRRGYLKSEYSFWGWATNALLIIILMFLGRVGVVTLAQALLRQYSNQNYKLPQDNIIIS